MSVPPSTIVNSETTLEAELAQVVQDEHDFVGRLVPQHPRLQVALVDADDEGQPQVVGECALGDWDLDLVLLVLELEVAPGLMEGYLSLPNSSNSGSLNWR